MQERIRPRVLEFCASFRLECLGRLRVALPIFVFLPFDDERVKSTMDVILKKLGREEFIYRFIPQKQKDREAAFVACSFWMVQNVVGNGRQGDAENLFEKLMRRRNDVGLLSEECDPDSNSFMGNFPQALCARRTH